MRGINALSAPEVIGFIFFTRMTLCCRAFTTGCAKEWRKVTPARGRVLAKKARSWWAEAAVFHARELLVKVGFAPAWRQIVEALRLSLNRRVIGKIFSFLVLWLRIMGSRLKRWVKSKLNTSVQRQASK